MPVVEQRTGTITAFYDADTGSIKDSVEQKDYDFNQHGAQVDFIQGKEYTYLRIITPQGRVIVKEIQKPQ